MKKLKVRLGCNSYDIYIGPGLLSRVGHCLSQLGFAGRMVIITDDTVKGLYGDAFAGQLETEGFSVHLLSVPAGEGSKSLEAAGLLYERLTGCLAERTTPVIALGGGVIGDLAGFVAATYMRGMPLVQIPTTLLAQVDSSIGGKVAVDHGSVKNKIGTFYQPRVVISDIDVLRTLPQAELENGLAEVIKTAAIRDRRFFDYLERHIKKAKALDGAVLESVVCRTARIKAEIVSQDERDTGIRAILNYGHTTGHAIETVSGFSVGHGRAVAVGMLAAARMSGKLELLEVREAFRLKKLIEQAGLLNDVPHLEKEKLIQAMRYDKKVMQDRLRFVLLRTIGDAFVTDEVTPELLEEVLADYE